MSEWISVDTALPKEGVPVLVFAPDCYLIGRALIGCHFDDQDSWTVYDFEEASLVGYVTHWQPLPEPPKEG